MLFALTEMEARAWAAELNTLDFIIPKERQVPAIVARCGQLYKKSAAAPDATLADTSFLIDGRFSVTDIIVSYAVNFDCEPGWLAQFPHLLGYLEREHRTLVRHG